MNNVDFRKTMKNVRKHSDIKLITNEGRRNYFMSEPNYYTQFFSKNVIAIEISQIQIFMNKSVYLGINMRNQ